MTPTETTPPGARAPSRRRTTDPDHQLPPAGHASDDAAAGTGLGDLLRELAQDTGTLVRQEIELARMEVTRTAAALARDSAWIGVGAAIAAVGGLVLVVAMALGLGALLGSYWLGTLITGVVLVLAGALFAWKGVRDIRTRTLAPRRTMDTLRDDADWAKDEAREFKQRLKE